MTSCRRLGWRFLLGISLLTCIVPVYAAAEWPPITPEEQALKDVAGQPGASAIVLQRQEVADDLNNFHSTYKRIKVLNEAGRKYADVELPYNRRGFSNNILVRKGLFKLNPDGSLSGEVVERRSGDHALYERYALKEANQQERLQRVERVLGHSLQGFTLQSLEIQQLDARDKELVLTYNFTVPNYVQVRGPLTLARPRILGEKTFALDQKPRHYAIEMHSASRENDVFEIEIAPGYKVDDVPDPAKIDMGFASYQSKSEVAGTKLRYSREYIIRDPHVGPERLADLRKFEGMIGSDEMAAVVLTHEP